jgi:nicotinamide mononucleotide (NMN) deamidase PncC
MKIAAQILDLAKERAMMIATAESCTGGMVAVALTDVAGSSAVVERGFVTYSNAAKIEMLGVAPATLAAHGAVSEAVAREMAEGALAHSAAQLAVAITGHAGPRRGAPPVARSRLAAPTRRADFLTASSPRKRWQSCRTRPVETRFEGFALKAQAVAFRRAKSAKNAINACVHSVGVMGHFVKFQHKRSHPAQPPCSGQAEFWGRLRLLRFRS